MNCDFYSDKRFDMFIYVSNLNVNFFDYEDLEKYTFVMNNCNLSLLLANVVYKMWQRR